MHIDCEKCGKQVDGWVMFRNDGRCGLDIIVNCHGAKDTCFISDDFLADWGHDLRLIKGSAFTAPAISAQSVMESQGHKKPLETSCSVCYILNTFRMPT